MKTFTDILGQIDTFVWGVPLMVFILGTGIFLTIRLRGIQFRGFGQGFKNMFSKDEKHDSKGQISGFAALCTALSATIGTGNIVGVATAIAAGGPGAMFWMWLAAIFGTATKYTECTLAVHYRQTAKDGHIIGGPFYYIEKGMGEKWKWLAKIFAFFGVCVGLMGIGTFTQINGITSAVKGFFDPQGKVTVNVLGQQTSIAVVIAGVVLTFFIALVIIGGLKRISAVAEKIVPFMAILYVGTVLILIFSNITKLPAAFVSIFEGAFGIRAITGGVIGTIIASMRNGIARGIFSNEAGLGSAPIAAAAAVTDYPAEQGLISMLGTFIDTIVICSMTGLAIIMTSSWNTGLEGVNITSKAFSDGLPFPQQVATFILMVCLVFFASTTILGWDYYSERCLEYLVGDKPKVIRTYRWLYIFCVFIGPYMTVSFVWTLADIFNGLMAIPNLIGLIALSGVCSKETKRYFDVLHSRS
ncbi:MAG: sodium:alanine symporter family protein [Lachnospiraceae bacterium]|uniref:Sodium:alanine symporter family protein n=1 Tax=Candidatus Weimeria bifida TaxID=2599074 RepID=A0A6N7IXS5_9FIRM|nr:sodium:alanine symporter family protein [Candidatus Weimeria bifida]RRF95112.1 MAG: sodium:alanine symporter family protein [Lachnospiraceae bacterium]